MAEQIPFGVATSLINKLASLAFIEIGRIYGVSDKLEDLKRTLESIHIVLSDAEKRQSEKPVIKHWITRFKEVLHDADDLLDGLAIKDLRRKVDGGNKGASKVRGFFSSENPLVFRAKLARKIEEIQKSFNAVAEEMSKLNLKPSLIVLRQNESDWRETSSFVLQSDIIGREEDKNKIIDLLKQTHTNQNVSLVAIVGMGGLGKTTLAQLVYNDADVQKLFHRKIWVCVSEDFEVKLLLKKMLKSLKNFEVDDLDLDQLQKMLQEELNGKRYVLVLDDVWNESQLKWSALKTYLMCGGEGSKIVVTTRSEMVSEAMGIKNPYVLKGLTKEQSWTLLKNLTFGDDTSGMSQSLESIGEKIAQKCGGVPLAIKTMGGLLGNTNKDSDQWLNILNDNIWRLGEESGSIIPVLKLSYQNLPLELRQCFAYCSLFPKDWTIGKDELIQLWMAQGYLASSIGTQSMEDVGNQYVKILLMRSFFQDASMDKYHVTIFKMHDLMHDLAMSVAGNDCLLVAKGKGIAGRPMHVAFEPETICSLDMFDESKVRTIIRCQVTSRLLSPSFKKKFKYLRVLDLSDSSITQLPESIDKIKHLRYLDLSNCEELISLPKSIVNLVCLQTFKLYCCFELVFPIEIIPKLINLRHLDIDCCKAFDEMMPAGLGKLTSLQYLSNFVVGDNLESKRGKLNELKELNNIRGNLEISNLGLVEDIALEVQEANLKAKKHIRDLWLRWGPGETNKNSDSLQLLDNLCPHQNLRELTVHDYPGKKFSSWLSTLASIVQINLLNFPHCQYLPPLERLPCLKKLLIKNMGKLQCIHYEEISDVFFPSLEKLIFIDCENLRGWQRFGDANKPNDVSHNVSLPPFPHLSSLKICQCPKLTCIPAFPHLVKKLELNSCSMKLLDETCLVQLEPPSLLPLSMLMHLTIGDVMEVEAIAEDWMQNLTSLKRLSFVGSLDIQHMARQLQHLPFQLEQLIITNRESDKLCLWENEDYNSTQLQAPFHCLHSLQEIRFVDCNNLRALPEEIRDLQSLRLLEIGSCHKLESLPEAMCCLTNLQSLYIYNCPLLEDRCKEESGEDWPKIAHIPNRDIH